METDLELAIRLADLADEVTMARWHPSGIETTVKTDGTLVTVADHAAEEAILDELQRSQPVDGFLGEEVGHHPSSTDRRWIVDGIDWTRSYATGLRTWGTLIALEANGEIVLGLASSPAQNLRWFATRDGGAFICKSNATTVRKLRVSSRSALDASRVATLPAHQYLSEHRQTTIEVLFAGSPLQHQWSHQNRVAEGEIDVCIWFGGDIWDHAAPSIIVEEAGGRFSDHHGTRRLDTRTALYTNGPRHDDILEALERRERG